MLPKSIVLTQDWANFTSDGSVPSDYSDPGNPLLGVIPLDLKNRGHLVIASLVNDMDRDEQEAGSFQRVLEDLLHKAFLLGVEYGKKV